MRQIQVLSKAIMSPDIITRRLLEKERKRHETFQVETALKKKKGRRLQPKWEKMEMNPRSSKEGVVEVVVI